MVLKASERGTFPVCFSGHYDLFIQLRVCVADSLPHVPRLSWSPLDASGGECVSIATGATLRNLSLSRGDLVRLEVYGYLSI